MKISAEEVFTRVAVISSAYRSVLISSLSILMPSTCSFDLIDMAKISIANTNREGDKGSRCLTPLSNLKASENNPLFITQLERLS